MEFMVHRRVSVSGEKNAEGTVQRVCNGCLNQVFVTTEEKTVVLTVQLYSARNVLKPGTKDREKRANFWQRVEVARLRSN
jgi:hypothetical protein